MSRTVLSCRTSPLTDRVSRSVVQLGQVRRVDQGQPGSDRGERGVGLGLVELGAGQLDLPGADVVGDHERGDVAPQVRLRDGRADRQVPADDQAELDLVVKEPDPGRADDVTGRAGDGVRGLAEEGRRDRVRVQAGIQRVRAVVHHLRDDSRRRCHRAEQVQRLDRYRLVRRFGGQRLRGIDRRVQGRPVGQQLRGRGGGHAESDHARGRHRPPRRPHVRARLTLTTPSP